MVTRLSGTAVGVAVESGVAKALAAATYHYRFALQQIRFIKRFMVIKRNKDFYILIHTQAILWLVEPRWPHWIFLKKKI